MSISYEEALACKFFFRKDKILKHGSKQQLKYQNPDIFCAALIIFNLPVVYHNRFCSKETLRPPHQYQHAYAVACSF